MYRRATRPIHDRSCSPYLRSLTDHTASPRYASCCAEKPPSAATTGMGRGPAAVPRRGADRGSPLRSRREASPAAPSVAPPAGWGIGILLVRLLVRPTVSPSCSVGASFDEDAFVRARPGLRGCSCCARWRRLVVRETAPFFMAYPQCRCLLVRGPVFAMRAQTHEKFEQRNAWCTRSECWRHPTECYSSLVCCGVVFTRILVLFVAHPCAVCGAGACTHRVAVRFRLHGTANCIASSRR